jgi:hypothetical protein
VAIRDPRGTVAMPSNGLVFLIGVGSDQVTPLFVE